MRTPLALALALVSAGAAACGPDDDVSSCSGIVAGDLVVTEVLADFGAPVGASGADEGHEWFEIYNASSRAIDLGGLAIVNSRPDGSNDHSHVMRAHTLAPGEYLVLGNTLPDLVAAHVDYGYANELDTLFNSDGGKLALRCGDTVVDEAIYDGVRAGQSRAFDGGGPPDYLANDQQVNWCSSDKVAALEYEPANFGTPGAPNHDCMTIVPGMCSDGGTMRPTVPPQPGDLTITEVMSDPDAVSDTVGEWFEVLANRDVDLNDLALDRAADTAGPKVVTSATCLRVTAGSYAVFARSADMLMNGGIANVTDTFSFSLVCGPTNTCPGDVRILIGQTELDSFTWPSSRLGTAHQLNLGLTAPTDNDNPANVCDATSTYGGGDRGTPGMPNTTCGGPVTPMCMDTGTNQMRPIVKPTAGQLVIDEWMADPASPIADDDGEWFEVRATADVDLNGLQAGRSALGTVPVVPAGGNCVRLATGQRAVIARSLNASMIPSMSLEPNPQPILVAGTFGFLLPNTASDISPASFRIGIDGTDLATATYTVNATPGRSFMIDSDGTQCVTPQSVAPYAANNVGTPGWANSPPEC